MVSGVTIYEIDLCSCVSWAVDYYWSHRNNTQQIELGGFVSERSTNGRHEAK